MASTKQNFQITEEHKEYIDRESERLGMSQSALINMCISRYKEEREGLAVLKNLTGFAEVVEKMQNMFQIANEQTNVLCSVCGDSIPAGKEIQSSVMKGKIVCDKCDKVSKAIEESSKKTRKSLDIQSK